MLIICMLFFRNFRKIIGVLLALFLNVTSHASIPNTVLSLASGSYGNPYLEVGTELCNIINLSSDEYGLKCITRTTNGSIDNIAIVLGDDTSFGISQSDAILTSPQKDDIRVIASLFEESVFVVASRNSEASSFNDIIFQKNVNISSPNSGENKTARMLMKEKGWERKDFVEVSRYEVTSLLCTNQIDVAIFLEAAPMGSFAVNLIKKCGVRLLSLGDDLIEKVTSKNKAFRAYTVPIDIYKVGDAPIKTLSVKTVLFASKDTPDELVYNVLKSLFKDFNLLKNSSESFKDFTVKDFFDERSGLLLHPGTEKFFKEISETQDSEKK